MGTVTGTIYKGGVPWPDVEVYFDIVQVFSDGEFSYPATKLTTETDANGAITAVVIPTPDNGSIQVRLTLPSGETILFWHSTADGDITIEEIILGAGSEEQIDTLQTLLAQYLKLIGGTMTGSLDFSGTDHGGIKFISLTTVQRDALTPAVGMVIYNTTDGEFQSYDGAWGSLGGGGAVWGAITGTLSDQTDLQDELDAKATTTALSDHAADTTNIHGIADTADLLDTADIGVSVADTAVHLVIAASDEDSDLEITTPAVTFRMPHAMTLTEVRANVNTAPVGSAIQVDINKVGGSSILSTKITIDAGEDTSETAATPPVISDTALADDVKLSIDIDAVGSSTAGTGLKIALIGTRP